MILSHPNYTLWMWPAMCRGNEQALMQSFELESAVETIGEGSQVTAGVLSEGECMVTTGETGLEVSEHGVDPLEFGQLFGFSSCHDGGSMSTSGRDDRTETRQSIGQHGAAWRQVTSSPVSDCTEAESGYGRELDAQRMAVLVEGDGGDKRDLVLRPTTDLATASLAAQIRVIDLHLTIKDITTFTLGHRLHEFVMHQPRGGVTDAEVALERQRGQSGLCLTNEVDGQKPDSQSKLGALKHGACDQRSLSMAGIALKESAPVTAHHAIRRAATPWATKALRPACLLKRRLALRFGSVPLKKLRHRQTRLELNSIHRHGNLPPISACTQDTGTVGSRREPDLGSLLIRNGYAIPQVEGI